MAIQAITAGLGDAAGGVGAANVAGSGPEKFVFCTLGRVVGGVVVVTEPELEEFMVLPGVVAIVSVIDVPGQ